jgi:hypothetical protein
MQHLCASDHARTKSKHRPTRAPKNPAQLVRIIKEARETPGSYARDYQNNSEREKWSSDTKLHLFIQPPNALLHHENDRTKLHQDACVHITHQKRS